MWRPVAARCNVNVFVLSAVISAFGVLTDLIIILLPMPVVLSLRMDLKRRSKSSLFSFMPRYPMH